MGLIQRGIEAAGIPTVSITHLPDVTAKIGVPRALKVPWPMGQAFGPAGAAQTHRRVLLTCLKLLFATPEPALVEATNFVAEVLPLE